MHGPLGGALRGESPESEADARRKAVEGSFGFAVVLLVSVPLAIGAILGPSGIPGFLAYLAGFPFFLAHELGHMLAITFIYLPASLLRANPQGEWLQFFFAAAGTAGELAFPFAFTLYYGLFYRRQPLMLAFLSVFLLLLVHVGSYMADAETLSGMVVGPDGLHPSAENPEQHDFYVIFGKLGIRDYAGEIGWLVGSVGLAYGAAATVAALISLAFERLSGASMPLSKVAFAGIVLASPFLALSSVWLIALLVPGLAFSGALVLFDFAK
jgi:hypothetical protein